MKKTPVLLLLLFAITAFRIDDEQHYKYRYVVEFFQDGKTSTFLSTEIMSYEDYLIEFITKDFMTTEVSGDTTVTTTLTEPDRVNFIHIASNSYFSINIFSKEGKIIEQGPLKQKKLGTIFRDTTQVMDTNSYKLSDCKDTIIHNTAYLYYPYSIKDQRGEDSILCKVLFIKKTSINLITQTGKSLLLDGTYPFAGAIIFSKERNEGTAMYVKDIMPLTDEETKTIKQILAKNKIK